MERLTRAINSMTVEEFAMFKAMLEEAARDMMHDEPSVGIFASEPLAEGFNAVVSLVEDIR